MNWCNWHCENIIYDLIFLQGAEAFGFQKKSSSVNPWRSNPLLMVEQILQQFVDD